ncbi:MAG: hypothetical protein Q4D61_03540 [Cardiobacteriaceae bacterium]|nr:hypothetical protein [Cardiobacteriaceae bacterium]
MSDDKRIAQLEKELQDFRKDFSDISQNLKDLASEKTEELQGQARKVYRRASARAGEIWDDVTAAGENFRERAGDHYDDAVRAVRGQVRDNPLQTLAIVAGIGFLVGFLSRR